MSWIPGWWHSGLAHSSHGTVQWPHGWSSYARTPGSLISSATTTTTFLPSPFLPLQNIHQTLWCTSFVPDSGLNILKASHCLCSQRAYSLEEGGGKSFYFGTSKGLRQLQAKERLREGHGLFLLGWDILAIFVGWHSNPVVPTCWPENQGQSMETKTNKDNIMNSSQHSTSVTYSEIILFSLSDVKKHFKKY